jgi:hypothetical protein
MPRFCLPGQASQAKRTITIQAMQLDGLDITQPSALSAIATRIKVAYIKLLFCCTLSVAAYFLRLCRICGVSWFPVPELGWSLGSLGFISFSNTLFDALLSPLRMTTAAEAMAGYYDTAFGIRKSDSNTSRTVLEKLMDAGKNHRAG